MKKDAPKTKQLLFPFMYGAKDLRKQLFAEGYRELAEHYPEIKRRVHLNAMRLPTLQADLKNLSKKKLPWFERVQIAIRLGTFRERGGVKALCKLIYDSNPEVRKNAAVSLNYVADRRALKPLMNAIAKEEIAQVRNALVLGIEGSGGMEQLISAIAEGRLGPPKLNDSQINERAKKIRGAELDERSNKITYSERKKMLNAIKNSNFIKYKGRKIWVVDGLPGLGRFLFGLIFIDSKIPKKFQEVVILHEFGEYFGHDIAVDVEQYAASRKGVFRDLLNWNKIIRRKH
ncbi:MAG: HEAT repeat domain-containing protein [Candidatus Diapherotrites archaeon]